MIKRKKKQTTTTKKQTNKQTKKTKKQKTKTKKLQRIYKTYDISTSFRPYCTLRRQPVFPKDPTRQQEIYLVYEVHGMNCSAIYIRHIDCQLGERLKEHKCFSPYPDKLSAVAAHFYYHRPQY